MEVSESHSCSLYTELTLTSDDPEELVSAGYDWLTLGLTTALASEPWLNIPQSISTGVQQLNQLNQRWDNMAIPCESVLVVDCWGEVSQKRPATAESLPWLLKQLSRRPMRVLLWIGSNMLNVDFEPDHDKFVKISWEVSEAKFSGSTVTPPAADAVMQTLWYMANAYLPVFGHVSYGNMGGRTELERNLPRPLANPYVNTPRWREFLRGYSWWNVVPNELLQLVGGASALRESGAFCEVLELSRGTATWLRATENFDTYRDKEVADVWLALRDIVIPGEPRPSAVYPGDPPNRMTVFQR
jgi:hypothetical protein